MDVESICPECGAVLPTGQSCQDLFDQMLLWEWEHPPLGEVHHLMVLCYHLQHPHLYSPEGLAYARRLLAQFVAQGLSPTEARQQNRAQVSSANRNWKITGTAVAFGAYDQPMNWTMTAVDIITGGPENYGERVRAWAQSIHQVLSRP
ncbi:MAG: hypothetical protein KF770_24975 [Anaerolineae bacterium]|nr:hypothetical protein [Anaerolineae bacterium]